MRQREREREISKAVTPSDFLLSVITTVVRHMKQREISKAITPDDFLCWQ